MTERERLIELLRGIVGDNVEVTSDDCGAWAEINYDNIADYLLSKGAILPPVSVGQTVYSTEKGLSQIFIGEVYEITKRGETVLIRYTRKGYYSGASVIENFGKTVFLTKEEAEKALERSRG